MERHPPILIRREKVRGKRITLWRLVCPEHGTIEPALRSKTLLLRVAEEHAEKSHPHDRVSLFP